MALSETSQKLQPVAMSDSDGGLSLPSNPGSASEEEVEQVAVSSQLLPGESQCCDADCLDRIASMPEYSRKADEIRQAIKEELGLEKRNEFQFQVLRTWMAGESSKSQSQRRYQFQDLPICRIAASDILQCNKGKVTKLTKEIVDGRVSAPRDLRVGGGQVKMTRQESLQVQNAETMWCWVHSFLAEPLAEGVGKVKFDVATKVKELLKMDPVSGVFNASSLEPRHVHPNVTLSELLLGCSPNFFFFANWFQRLCLDSCFVLDPMDIDFEFACRLFIQAGRCQELPLSLAATAVLQNLGPNLP